MNQKQNTVALVILTILVSGMGGYLLGSRSVDTYGHQMPDGSMMSNSVSGMSADMTHMMSGLQGKEGDALDEAFLSEMIVHHEGAVDMANAILANGKHPELKKLAQSIVTAQSMEIAQMKEWQHAWYGK